MIPGIPESVAGHFFSQRGHSRDRHDRRRWCSSIPGLRGGKHRPIKDWASNHARLQSAARTDWVLAAVCGMLAGIIVFAIGTGVGTRHDDG